MPEPHLISSIHFYAGCLTLLFGLCAMISVKGSVFHRFSGRVFVALMSALVMTGLWMSFSRGIIFTVFLAVLTAYAFLTAWATVASHQWAFAITKSAPIISMMSAIGAVIAAQTAATARSDQLNGLPPLAFYSIAMILTFTCLLDIRYLRLHRASIKTKLIRHTWRMGCALLISTVIFFFGNNHVLPESLRTPLYLSLPVLLVFILTVIYILLVRFSSSWMINKWHDLKSSD